MSSEPVVRRQVVHVQRYVGKERQEVGTVKECVVVWQWQDMVRVVVVGGGMVVVCVAG